MNFDNTNFIYNTLENFILSTKDNELILFGAGNEMIKAIDNLIIPQKLSVAYAVDNDFHKWYSRYKGIEIREPLCLKEGSDEIVVLITSLYPYRIEKQLQRMGIKNYFSYMLFLEKYINKEQFMVTF